MKRNIAQFGGDKNNVTLGGQSAGATGHRPQHGVAARHRPVPPRHLRKLLPCQFSGLPDEWHPPRATGVAFSVAAGCGSGTGSATAKCLRNLTAAQVEALAGTASAASQYVHRPDGGRPDHTRAAAHGLHQRPVSPRAVDEREHGGRKNFVLAITEYYSGPPRMPPTAAQYLNFVNTTYAPPDLSGRNGGESSGQLSAQRLREPATGVGQGLD